MSDQRNSDQREAALEALRKSEEQLRLIAENTSDNISITTFDLKAVYIYINPSIKSLLGYDPEEMLGKSFFDFIHPDDKKVLLPLLKKYLKLKLKKLLTKMELPVSETIEFRFKDKTGNWHFMQSTVNIMGDQLLAVTRDISEHKQAETALKTSEERLKIIFDYAPDAIYLSDLKGNFLDGNKAAEELIGYKKEELIGENFLKLKILSGNDLPKAIRNLAKNVLGKRTGPDEFSLNRKDGSQVSLEISNFPVKIKGRTVILGVARDISERKKTEEALLESEEKFRNYVETSQDLIWECDATGKFIYLNPAWEQVTGYKLSEMLGRPFTDFTIKEEVEKNTAEFIKHLEGGFVKGYPSTYISKNGSKIYLIFNAIPLYDPDKNIIGTQGSAYDITERKLAEENLMESEERFSQIAENSQEWIWEVDSNGLYTYSSNMIETLFGYKGEEIVGKKHFYDLFFPEEREELKNAAFNVFRQKQPFKEFINRNLTKEGKIIWLSTSGVPLLNENGDLLGYRGSDTNITEKKLSDEKLMKNQYYLSKAQELGKIGTWELDIKKNILIWTDENYRIFGVPPGTEMNYEIFLNCVHPDDREYVNEAWNAGLNKEPYDIEHRLIDNEEVKWVREKADIEFDPEGNPVMAIGFTQDITDRKKAEEEIIKLKDGLEVQVAEKTKELNEKIEDLQRFFDAAVDRELRMKELSDENEKLTAELEKLQKIK